jgi:hypothetical protein
MRATAVGNACARISGTSISTTAHTDVSQPVDRRQRDQFDFVIDSL